MSINSLRLPCQPVFSQPNPTRIRCVVKLGSSSDGTATSPRWPPSDCTRYFRVLSASSAIALGLGLTSLWAFPHPASARILPATQLAQDTVDVEKLAAAENLEDEDMEAAFEQYRSKTYALSVPLRVVSLEGSVPPVWIKEFLRSQGKRVRFKPEFRRSLQDIFYDLSNPFHKGKINPKSAVGADLVTLGDSWLNFAIDRGLIEPVEGAEDQSWFRDLSDRWKVYLRRSADGNLHSKGKIWAVPYRWGSMVIAYNKKELQKHNIAPIEDWSDLWRPELAGKISMIDSPREIIGAVLKYMGASYNTRDFDSQVTGGKHAVLKQLELLFQQVRLFDSQHYLKAFKAGDVWVAIGWSSDVIPAAKTMSNIAVVVPKSGASLWADFWAIPNASRLDTDRLGGRTRGPSPLIHQWIDFCLQPQRASPFQEEIVPGASPISLDTSQEPSAKPRTTGRPKLETNLVRNIPPADILSKCEFLEPLSENAVVDYQWLISDVQKKPGPGFVDRLRLIVSSRFSS